MSEKLIAIKDYLVSRIESVENSLKLMIDPKIGAINVSGLTKKEKDAVINQRNCLLVQRHCYNEILDLIKEKK